MKTISKIIFGNSNNMKEIEDESVNLMITSPPYPMIEMWDGIFSDLNHEIRNALDDKNGPKAYDLMNEELNKTWKEVDRTLAYGGIACVNIGDATRKIGDSFQLYANHSRITYYFEKMGYQVLPLILWRKSSNKPNKYMGSGMLPPNAYVTLEHEYILVFRKKGNRQFKANEKPTRQKSAYFWEERNEWFSDIWYNLSGVSQALNHKDIRERSAAFPFELAYRIINMYSAQEDTVLDPFLGTGTTTIAAMCAGRNSIGYELDPNFQPLIDTRLDDIYHLSNKIVSERLENHVEFVKQREKEKGELKHQSVKYGFPVMTNQEKKLELPIITKIQKQEENEFLVDYTTDESILEDSKNQAKSKQTTLAI